eukprot:CAMPEP_0194492804 /NCGR_PEP_ID=MMETSP0253-20130528/11235_1 /TAXON_ID=2966 /ORGANISM="Noctiluca scintillans" /LENGTH=55 /DNA_ID=CAMNT_0039333717 /DNA_START=129 /DNA_END=293 /DNA_ORIENTATION=-
MLKEPVVVTAAASIEEASASARARLTICFGSKNLLLAAGTFHNNHVQVMTEAASN